MPFYEDFQTLIEEEEKRKTSLNNMVGSPLGIYFGETDAAAPYEGLFDTPAPTTPIDDRGAFQYALNETLGAGLWGFLESGTLADLWVPEEEREKFQLLEEDPETLIGKTSAALGHLGGFVLGAPMKAIGKPVMAGLTKLAADRTFKKIVKEGGEDLAQRYVAGTAKNIGKQTVDAATAQGIKKELAEDMVKGFQNIAGRSMLNKNIGKNYTKHMDDAVDNLTDYYVKMGEIGAKEGKTFGKFFKDAFKKQPIQTLGDVAAIRGGDPRWGNLMHEALMFGAIDAVLEVPRAYAEDRTYDWTAPLWGLGIGAGFGGLKFLKPMGKGTSFATEIVDGVKSYMGKNPYLKKSADILSKHANFIGQSMDDVGVLTRREGKIGAKEYAFDLKNSHAGAELIDEFGELGAQEILAKELNLIKQSYSKELIKWAGREELTHLKEVFPRMVAGAIIMNAPTIAEIARHGMGDMTIDDILPSIFIGAGLQYRGLPRTWDFGTRIKKIREGLKVLGADTRNMQRLPSFSDAAMDHMNPMNTKEEFRKIRKMAEDRGIVSDEWDLVRVKTLSVDEISVLGAEAGGKDFSVFNSVYKLLQRSGKFTRNIDDISVKDAKAIQDAVLKYKWDELGGEPIVTARDFDRIVDKAAEGAADRFENMMVDALINIGSATQSPLSRSESTMGTLPKTIRFSREIELMAKNGELEWLVDAEGNVLSGADALAKLDKAKYGAGSMISLFKSDGMGRVIPSHQDYVVETTEASKVIYETVNRLEDRINKDADIKDNMRFDLVNDIGELAKPMVLNAAKKSAKGISELFDVNNKNEALVNELRGQFSKTGLLQEGLTKPYEITRTPNKINITGETDEAKVAEARRFLNSVHSILVSKGQYAKVTDNQVDVPYSTIMGNANSLRKYLSDRGMRTQSGVMEQFNTLTTNYILRDKIKDSNLDMHHMDFIVSLMNTKLEEGGSFVEVAGQKGKVYGWSMRYAEAGPGADSRVKASVDTYNRYVKEVIDASKTDKGALVTEHAQKAILVNPEIADFLTTSMHYNMEGSRTMAKQTITHFLNALDMSHGAFKLMVQDFVNSGNSKNAVRLLQWLKAHKIITRVDGEEYTRYSLNAEKAKFIKDEVLSTLTTKMQRFGISRDEYERLFQKSHQAVEDLQFRGFGSETTDTRLTRDQFFGRYFSGDESLRLGENQVAELENLIYQTTGKPDVPGYSLEKAKYIRRSAVDNILKSMTVKINGETRPVMELQNESGGLELLREARDDARHMFLSVVGSGDRTFFTFNNGNLQALSKNVANTKFYQTVDEVGISHIPIIGTSDFFYTTPEGALRNSRFSIFDAPSDYLPTKTKAIVQDQLAKLQDSLNSSDKMAIKNSRSDTPFLQTTTATGDHGLVLMRIADSIQPFATMKSDMPRIAGKFEELMKRLTKEREVRLQDNKPVIDSVKWNRMQRDLRRLQESTEQELGHTPEHERALRALLFHKLTASSKDGSFFIDLMNGSEDAVKAAKRFQLFHTPQMRPTMRGTASNNLLIGNYEKEIANHFDRKGTAGVVIWNDKQFADIKENLSPENRKFWEENMGDRDSESMFDSISFVSRRFRDYEALSHGMYANSDARIIKPVISSNGEVLLYGKTVFVYDAALENFFKNNRTIDIVTTASASKIHGKEQWKMVDKDADGLINARNLDAGGFVNQIPLGDIRVKSDRIKDKDYARVSQQIYNYMDSNEATDIYRNMYEAPLTRAMEDLGDLIDNPLKMRAFFSDNIYDNAFVETMAEGAGGTQVLGALRMWADHGNPMELGQNAVLSQVFNKMIDPVMKPRSEMNGMRYGGKAVLMQSLGAEYRDLRFTKVTKDGKVEQYGEIVLPYQDKFEPIKNLLAREKNMKIKLLDTKTNEFIDPEQRMGDAWDRANTLGELHNFLDMGAESRYQIAIVTTRYPRTRPNDLGVLGLRAFGSKESGNAAIVNAVDVLNIFEGDYDVDKTDYFWMKHDRVFNHIKESSNFFAQGIDPDKVFPSNMEGLGFYRENAQEENKLWHKQIANSSVLGKGLGIVQKVPRIINHIRDIAEPRVMPDGSTKYILMESSDGRQRIEIDYNNKDWFQRMVLEAQTIIDAGSSINKDIMEHPYEWRDSALFQLMSDEKSTTWGKVNGGGNKIGFLSNLKGGDNSGGRVRIFRKYDTRRDPGQQEVDLLNVDKAIIKTLMKNYSDFLQLGTRVYDNTGKGKRPSYEDVQDMSAKYFTFMGDMPRSVYWKLQHEYKNNDDFRNYFRISNQPGKKTKRALWKESQDENFVADPVRDYYWEPPRNSAGPFSQATYERSQRIYTGKGGNVFDRMLWKVWDADPLKMNEYRALSVDESYQMEQAMQRFYGPKGYKALDEFTSSVITATSDILKSQSYLRYLKRQFGIISKLRISEKMKNEKRIELNGSMKQVEDKIFALASFDYKKSKKAKDIREPLIKYHDLTNQDVQDGAVQMYSMNAITRVLGTKNIKSMNDHIDQLRAFEKAAFMDMSDLGHTMTYGPTRTFLSQSQNEYLNRFFHDHTQVYDIINHYMEAGVQKWGFSYLYNYAAPISHKNAIGIFNGKPVPVSYGPTKRFNRAMKFMANKAVTDPDYKGAIKQLAPVVDYYRQYFQKDTRLMAEDLLIDPTTGLNICSK